MPTSSSSSPAASAPVDRAELDERIHDMYAAVAEDRHDDLHFEIGRGLAERLGYPAEVLDGIPAEAVRSFAGVGYFFDLAALQPGERVLDLGSGSGTDVFFAARRVGEEGAVTGVDFTAEQLAKAEALRARDGFENVRLREGRIEDLPLEDASVDAVISNGVINLIPDKAAVFREAARVLAPGGRVALADIVTGRPIKQATRSNAELWAACIAGAIPRGDYVAALEAAGLELREIRENREYRFISERAASACSKYEVVSVSLVASKRG